MADETPIVTPAAPEPAAGAESNDLAAFQAQMMAHAMALPVEDWILLCISLLGMQAARRLGLAEVPLASLPDRDALAQARLALDAAGGLAEATMSHLPYEDVKQIRQVLEDLRMVHARADSQANPEPGPVD